MTKIHITVPDQEATIISPIVLQVLNEIRRTWFYDTNTRIMFLNHTGSYPVRGAEMNSDPNDVILDSSNRIEATCVTKLMDDHTFANNPLTQRGPAIFTAVTGNAKLNLARFQTRFTLVLKYTSRSKADVNNWINNYISRASMGRGVLNCSASLEVVIPKTIPWVLNGIHAQEATALGVDSDFPKYLKDGFEVPYSIQQAPNSPSSRILVLTETLNNIVIPIPLESPEISRVEGGSWETELTLEFDISVPSIFLLDYSEFVAGDWLPDEYFDKTLDRNKVNRRRYPNGAQMEIITGYLLDKSEDPMYRNNAYIYPQWDSVNVLMGPIAVNPVLQVRLSVDPNDLKAIVDLSTLANDIGITLHPDMVTYLIDRKELVFKGEDTLVSLGISRDGVLSPKYTVDAQGMIRSDYDLDPIGNYHLTVKVKADLPTLSEVESNIAFEYGSLFNAVAVYNHPGLDPRILPEVDEDGRISQEDVLTMSKHIKTTYRGVRSKTFTVSTLVVETK
jgi:hypothetical protein